MKILQLQKDFLTMLSKKQKVYGQKIENKFAISDSYRFYIINDDEFYLDKTKINEINIENFINLDNLKNIIDTKKVELDDNFQYRIFEFEDKEKAYVNNKFLKYFNKEMNYKSKGINQPIHCYEDDEFVGMILPIRRGDK